MRSLVLVLGLFFPMVSLAATFTGKISTISINETNNNIVFEVVDSENETCLSSWFKVKKPSASEMSPASFALQAYLNNTTVTIHSPTICAEVTGPAAVNRVTLGASASEIKALIEKIRQKKEKK